MLLAEIGHRSQESRPTVYGLLGLENILAETKGTPLPEAAPEAES